MLMPHRKQRLYTLLLLGFFFQIVPAAHAIINGRNARSLRGQVQVLEITAPGSPAVTCTGSLIGPSWVLTADHCVTNRSFHYAILAGNLHFNAGTVYSVSHIYADPGGKDAALLQLEQPVPESVLVPVQYGLGLPSPPSHNSVGNLAVQGWGDNSANSSPAALQIATPTIVSTGNGFIISNAGQPIPGVLALGDSGAGYFYLGVVCGVHGQTFTTSLTTTFRGAATDALGAWIRMQTSISAAPARVDGTEACEFPREQDPIEIYAEGGTVPVAAYSTVRSLSKSSTSVRLYQLQRRFDNAMRDIASIFPDGYVDAAAQDSFCANTTCVITQIYDQSPFGNDLSIEGAGGAKNSPDSGAVANALPITIKGHKAYGVSITPGVGYRDNNAIAVARNVGPPPVNKTPEGMYMVTSGRNFNGACCFDFGNAETNTRDNGNGRMDALNFGSFCGFPPCAGSGPWVQADLENGQYMGGGNNPSNTANISLPFNFVTAMLKNDSQSTFALRGGNAQDGPAVRLYNGSLPTQKGGYVPMQLEGAIVLGTGGDNSAGGVGSFFEGVVVNGYPSDDTENAVQMNITAAGYSGNSIPTNGEPPTYTGPNNPQGAGPGHAFEHPSEIQPNDLMGSKPAMAYFHDTGKIHVAFQANDASHKLFVTSTYYGAAYPPATNAFGIHIGGAPAMAEFRHQLYVAFQADDNSHQLFVTSSGTGSSFPNATPYPNILIGSSPAMVEFRHQLFIAFQANDAGHTLHITASPDGRSFPAAAQVPNVQIGSAPAMAVFRSQIFIAFRANDPSNDLWIASSTDGYHYTSYRIPGPNNTQTMGLNSSPALVASNNVLYCIYGAATQANEMLVMSSADGITWQGPTAYLDDSMGSQGPGATAIPGGITVGFQSNDSRNVLFTSHEATEGVSYDGPNNSGGAQDGFGSPAFEQSPDLMGSKPALASFNNKIFLAFQATNGTHDLFTTSTVIGTNYTTATAHADIQVGSAPAFRIFGSNLWMAFQADDGTNDLFVTTSPDGGNSWPKATAIPNIKMGGAPSLTNFENKLLVAFQADDPTHLLFLASSSDGKNWPSAHAIPNVKMGSDPAIEMFKGSLYVAFRADDPGNATWIASSNNGGQTFSSQLLPGTMGGSSSPALVTDGKTLYYIYEANDLGNEMLVMTSSDGTHWDGPEVYPGLQLGSTGPGASYYTYSTSDPLGGSNQSGITVGFQSNDSREVLFTTTKSLN